MLSVFSIDELSAHFDAVNQDFRFYGGDDDTRVTGTVSIRALHECFLNDASPSSFDRNAALMRYWPLIVDIANFEFARGAVVEDPDGLKTVTVSIGALSAAAEIV